MKSDVIRIDNQGNGFADAVAETRKVAAYQQLGKKETLRLELITEEMLSLVRSVTGEMEASFWMEGADKRFEFHMTTKTVMDQEKRYLLISSATSRKNEASRSFLGFLRNKLEEAMAAPVDHSDEYLPEDLLSDLAGHPEDGSEWDGYERSVLRTLTDNIKMSIKGGLVEMTVIKEF